jgi:pimeloyl-ACP methyl ester carboxylesterase
MAMIAHQHQFVPAERLKLHVAASGPPSGELVVLLHGFPEFWYGWRHQMPALAAAGYRVWAPDQRGYNISDKPAGVRAYALDHLAADVVALLDAAGVQRAHLVGHDWGAAVGWHVATIVPRRVQSLVAINVPHGAVMRDHLLHDWRQLLRSWYMFAFQLPAVPEKLAAMQHYRYLVNALIETARPGTWSAADLSLYREAWAQPQAMHSMINWYRAALLKPPRYAGSVRIEVPALVLWGAQDRFLGADMARESAALCHQGEWRLVPHATHWVHHEEPELVNDLLCAWLARHAIAAG